MEAILFLVFLAIVSLVLWRMWLAGEISGFAPQTRREKIRHCWLIVGIVNFLAFGLHMGLDGGACALAYGGRLVGEQYLVPSHGKDIPLSPDRYFFNLWHGVLFVIVHLMCMFAMCRLRGTGDTRHEPKAA